MSSITAHMVVKNEDYWVWYAIQSILPYVDVFLITDTGSTDRTIELIKSIDSPKIKLLRENAYTPQDITKVRNKHITATKTDWIWIIDGDEIYPKYLCAEIIAKIENPKSKISGIVVRRFDLLGDVYHSQSEEIGAYEMYGRIGHFSMRLLNIKQIEGLTYKGDYPYEGFYDEQGRSILDYDKKYFTYTKAKYFHAGYLQRSTLGANLIDMFNRHKYKIEKGHAITDSLPEVLSLKHPFAIDPLKKRGLTYTLASSVITPIKYLKRRLVK